MIKLPEKRNPKMSPAKKLCRAQFRCTVPCEEKAVCSVYLVQLESDQTETTHYALDSHERIVSVTIGEEIYPIRFPGAALHEFQEMMEEFSKIITSLHDLLDGGPRGIPVVIRVAHHVYLDWKVSFFVFPYDVPSLKKMIDHFRGFIIWTK